MATKKTAKKSAARVGGRKSSLLSFTRKQWVIIAAFVILFGGVGTYFLTKSNAAVCADYVYKYGSSGYCVSKIQTLVNVANCEPIGVDGYFGANTTGAVKNFQYYYNRKYGALVVDGVVGPKTWAALYNYYNNQSNYPCFYPKVYYYKTNG